MSRVSLAASIQHWWHDRVAHDGFFPTARQFIATLWEFASESTPSRRRQRYGDVDYDWDFRVDTTAATVGWRDRLLGHFHSSYQPTEPTLFHEMLESLKQVTPKINLPEFTFIDIGSGKGRALLLASQYPFKRILGIELLPELHRVAKDNISKYKSDSQKCFAIECVLADASAFAPPAEPTVIYLFNPLPESALITLTNRLEDSLRRNPRPVFVIYHNPMLDYVLARSAAFKKILTTHQYSIFASEPPK
jgi:SAM-dependent methyltransferase